MTGRLPRWFRATTAATVLVAAAACGSASAPGDAEPGLRIQLVRIDTALVRADYGTARTALAQLVRQTVAARDAGRIPGDRADRILGAADRLVRDLPGSLPAPPTTTTRPAPGPTGAPATLAPAEPKNNPGEGKDSDRKEDKDKDKGVDKKKGKGGDKGKGGGGD